jgi:hypothetical protein
MHCRERKTWLMIDATYLYAPDKLDKQCRDTSRSNKIRAGIEPSLEQHGWECTVKAAPRREGQNG